MKKLLPFILLFFTISIFSQKEANIWYFGRNAGIDFNTTPPTAITNGQINTLEGCSSFADGDGNLLFYSDGITVYDKNHQKMRYSNGTPADNLRGNPSSTQSGMIIPKPGSTSIYYLFTVGDNNNPAFDLYTIDMSLNGGNGQLIDEDGDGDFSENLAQIQTSSSSWTEKVAAVRGKECNTFWVVSKVARSFFSYKVDINGVNLTPVESQVNNNTANSRGYLKLSPNGKKLAIANQNTNNDLLLYSFDNETGIVANDGISIFNDFQDGEAYGVEFSRNSERLYVSSASGFRQDLNAAATTYKLFQYDLTASDIGASKTKIYEQNGYRGALQLGPDGKIYATIPQAYDDTNGDATFLDAIENPNAAAADVIFTKNAINLGGQKSTQGLPPFISSLLLPIKITDSDTNQEINDQDLEFCVGDNKTIVPETVLGNNITYEWTFDNGTTTSPVSNTSSLTLNNLNKTDSGSYALKIELTDDCGNITQFNGTFNVQVFDAASATPIIFPPFCDSDRDGFNTFDFQTETTPNILNGLDPAVFEVLYFTSLADANSGDNPLTNPYTNPSAFSSQTIYARVQNKNAFEACFDTTSFTLTVTDLPVPTQPEPYRICDDIESSSDTDGIINTFLLNTKDVEIFGSLDPNQYNITYHTTQNGADTNDPGTLIDKKANHTVSTSQTVYVRIENKDNIDCYDSSILLELIVDPLPTLKPNPALDQCISDTNSNPTVNLTLAESSISETLNIRFEYYEDAIGTNLITDPTSYPVQVNTTQSVYVKVISEFECARELIELTINVGQTPNNPYHQTRTL